MGSLPAPVVTPLTAAFYTASQLLKAVRDRVTGWRRFTVLAYAAAQVAAPGHLVLYRVGEFYETLHGDAATVSRLLGIQLTRRPQKNASGIPMCGTPAGPGRSPPGSKQRRPASPRSRAASAR